MRVILIQPKHRTDPVTDIRRIAEDLKTVRAELVTTDILVLPELIGADLCPNQYFDEIARLARATGASVVGGSHHHKGPYGLVNRGIVVDDQGRQIAEYQKAHPYHREKILGVVPGMGGALFRLGSLNALAVICADFWHLPLSFSKANELDLVIVCAFSVSQRSHPAMARARWRHAVTTRAYELPAFVAMSDWAHPVTDLLGTSSGSAGFAHPNPLRSKDLFRRLGQRSAMIFDLDLARLRELRQNLRQRGFGNYGDTSG